MLDDQTARDVEDGCGFAYDHTTVETYRGPDGVGWECRECGAEGWEPADNDKQKEDA